MTAVSELPTARTLSAAEQEAALHAPVYPLPRLQLVSGKGARVVDAQGREYLDFVSGIAVNAFGHAPAGLARVVTRQMKSLGHVSNLFGNPRVLELEQAITRATGYERAFFCNSGTEGVEAALKFTRAHARARGRDGRDLVAFRGGFHGRTGFALSVTWTPSYREPFEPLIPGVRFADLNDIAGLDAVLDERVAGVIVEPVQGEGGAIPATREFLRALRTRTEQLGIPLVFDEVQCGMGRCGRLLAAEHYGVRAELTVLSKALGHGVPIAAVLMTQAIADSLAPGMHGSTFGGNPVASSAALWVLERVNRRGLLAGVRRRGKTLLEGLETLVARHDSLAAARGLGLLCAIELSADATFTPADLVAAARENALLLVRGGERAIRLLPPLDVSDLDLQLALDRLEAALASLAPQGVSR
ncbi:MAG: aspartate aminotransferase family protein [Candidatus Eisenbacteria bacterium]|uniref:Aspartate aminotransferase family protein n=1 Tax=Eiseniibacteriota bacterium TaxID=2212470 RepID=A0A849SHZ0_UNCEI|nr:aspartate aminotransferase family protein [Candidatus Eisenbacteria bacterium]